MRLFFHAEFSFSTSVSSSIISALTFSRPTRGSQPLLSDFQAESFSGGDRWGCLAVAMVAMGGVWVLPVVCIDEAIDPALTSSINLWPQTVCVLTSVFKVSWHGHFHNMIFSLIPVVFSLLTGKGSLPCSEANGWF